MDTQQTDSIRHAVAAGEFERATQLWHAYAGRIQQEICRGTCTEARIAEAESLLAWSRREVLCARAHGQDLLNTMQVARRYESAESVPGPFLRASL